MAATGHRRRVFELEPTFWWHVALRDLVRSFLPRAGRWRLLDAGCGTGMHLAELSRRFPVVGLDLSDEDLGYARARGNRDLLRASIADVPIRDGAVDAVLSVDVLCCLAPRDEARALAELSRVLRPGGLLVLHLPAYQWLRSETDVVGDAVHRYTRGEVRRKLRALGLTEVRATYHCALLFPLALATRLYGRLRPGAAPRSDVRPLPPPLNALLRTVQLAENALVRAVDLPFGLGVLAVFRKAGPRGPTPSADNSRA